jgi:hypothetical protein
VSGPIFPGRFTATHEGPLVVFLIGMRINRLVALGRWLPTFRAMGPMLAHLQRHPAAGFLGGTRFLYPRGAGLVQYWTSFDALEHFASDPGAPHREAWRRFNRAIGADGSVGVWHETYEVAPGRREAIYVNMPAFGLAAATGHAPVTRHSARDRIEAQSTPNSGAP